MNDVNNNSNISNENYNNSNNNNNKNLFQAKFSYIIFLYKK